MHQPWVWRTAVLRNTTLNRSWVFLQVRIRDRLLNKAPVEHRPQSGDRIAWNAYSFWGCITSTRQGSFFERSGKWVVKAGSLRLLIPISFTGRLGNASLPGEDQQAGTDEILIDLPGESRDLSDLEAGEVFHRATRGEGVGDGCRWSWVRLRSP